MNKNKKIILTILIIGLSAQLYIDFYISNFKFSFAAVMFPILLYMCDEINPILLGFSSAFSLYFFRILFCIISGGILKKGIINFFPEAIFYIIYSIVFYIFGKLFTKLSIKKIFFIALGCDFLSNIVEVFIRIGMDLFSKNLYIIKFLAMVAFVRAGIALLIIIGFKYYRMFLVKEEHEKRYKKLLWMTSRLKTEIYWMQKNMDNIENVMSNAYELFLKINNEEDRESWANRSLEISKDVHEIKKEYGLVVRGIEDILANKLDDKGMYFHELALILKESMDTEIKYQNKNIILNFDLNKNFYTEKHYYLMSILRNIIMNSIDSIEHKGKIVFIHKISDEEHLFIIKDNGSGINKKDLKHIFSPGYSTKINYNTGKINRGLGLSLVKNIVENQLNGNISVFSEKNKGTTFKISIPIIELEGIKS